MKNASSSCFLNKIPDIFQSLSREKSQPFEQFFEADDKKI